MKWFLIFLCLPAFGQLPVLPQAPKANATTLDTGLVAYWKFDSITTTTAIDSVGTNKLTQFPTPAIWTSVSGVISNAAQLGGGATSETFYAPDNNDLSAGPGVSFTVQAWYSGVNAFVGTMVIGKWDVNNHNEYLVNINTGPKYFFFVHDTTNAQWSVDSTLTATNGGKTQICAGYDDALHQIWIQCDGGTRHTATVVGVIHTNTALPFTVGNYGTNGSSPVNGFVDEAGFWHRSLSSAEVIQLWNGGAGTRPPSVLTP